MSPGRGCSVEARQAVRVGEPLGPRKGLGIAAIAAGLLLVKAA